MTKLRWIMAPLAAVLLALSAACGGDDDNAGGNAAGRADSASGSGVAVSQELNLAQAATSLLELRSFRFDLSFKLDLDLEALMESEGGGDAEAEEFGQAFAAAFLALFSDVSLQGAYVAPDSFDVQTHIGGEDARYVQIGNEAWTDDGNGWTEADPGSTGFSPFGDPTDFALDMLPDAVLRNADISEEEVGGVPAVRYRFDKAALEAVASELGEDTTDFEEVDEMQLDVWLIEGNIPVKFEIKASGRDADGNDMGLEAKFEITDINSDISIERPIP